VIFAVLCHWIPEVHIDGTIAMAENDSEILPYHFEPMSVSTNDSADESDSSESETDIREQASFTELLGSTSWCVCAKCTPMPSGIECQCCREMEGVSKHIAENESCQCITDHEQFKVVCLNKDVLYTALIMMNMIRGDPLSLPLPNKCVMATFFLIVHIMLQVIPISSLSSVYLLDSQQTQQRNLESNTFLCSCSNTTQVSRTGQYIHRL